MIYIFEAHDPMVPRPIVLLKSDGYRVLQSSAIFVLSVLSLYLNIATHLLASESPRKPMLPYLKAGFNNDKYWNRGSV